MSAIPLCHHFKANGVWCGSPALRGCLYCHFHYQWLRTKPRLQPADKQPALDIPLLEDANAVQVALQRVIQAIVTGQIDNKKAGLLLYALQTASYNLKHTDFEHHKLHDQARAGYAQPQAADEEDSCATCELRDVCADEPEAAPDAEGEEIAGAPSFAERSGAKGGNSAPAPLPKPPASELSDDDLVRMLRQFTRGT